jgi:hypothetical protein
MAINIFQFNWILIDTIVIILLILFLVCVKIFKERYRWRSNLSNIALDRYVFDKQFSCTANQNIIVQNVKITINHAVKTKSMLNPIILVIRTKKNKRLINILTEGLASYGFHIININLYLKTSLNHDSLETKLKNEYPSLISTILDFIKQKHLITNSNYLTVIHGTSKISYLSILNNKNNMGMILINPKIDNLTLKEITQIIEEKDLLSKFTLIFSKKSGAFRTNKNLKRFLTYLPNFHTLNSNIRILDKSKSSFKYYETILLGMLVDIIKSNILKS